MKYSIITILLVCFTSLSLHAKAPFELSITHPAHPDFKKNLLGFYGINSELEPQVTKNEKPIYEKIVPHLENNPDEAISILEKSSNEKSNAAFDYLLGILY